MKFSQFFSAQRVIKQILDWIQIAKSESIRERVSDVFTDGVMQGEFNNLAIVGKDIDLTLLDFFHVKVDTGVSYKSGERILIDNASITYDLTNLTHTTNDGLGNPISTPRSTGSYNIPLTAGSVNYIWIAYMQATDDSVFTLHRLTNGKQFYKRTDGYKITVTTANTNPDSSQYIFLGQVDLSGANTAITSNISIVNRNLARTQLKRVMIETSSPGKTDRPANYALGPNLYNLDDHIKAVGSGPITPFNPHGVTLEDMGVSTNQTVEVHRKVEHTNGIVTLALAPTTSGLFVQRVQITPGDDYVLVKALVAGEFAVVNGLAFDFTNIPTDTQLNFTGAANGTYNIYYDSVTLTFGKTLSNIDSDTTKLFLASTIWDGTTIPGDGNLSVPFDKRRFGTTNLLQRWYTTGRPVNPMPGTHGYNLDTNLPEYWNGITWNGF